MAPEVVDLISSSPPPQRLLARPDGPRAAEPLVLTFGAGSRTTSRLTSTDTISSSFSTFPSSDPGPNLIARDLPLEAERSPKRRRLSQFRPGGPDHQAPVSSLESSPSVRRSSPYERPRLAPGTEAIQDDGLQGDSDPFASSPLPSAAAIVSRKAPPIIDLSSPPRVSAAAKRAGAVGTADSEILLGSPEPEIGRIATVNRRPKPSSPNPFESSPLPAARAAKHQDPKVRTALDLSDPFASSPQPQRTAHETDESVRTRQPLPRKLRDYDPISSSAPEPLPSENTTFGWTSRAPGALESIITIEDSDAENDESSDDDELPDIHNIKAVVPRHAAREPMRRALSDTYATSRKTSSRQPASPKPKVSAEERNRAREAKQRAQEADKEAKKQEREQQKRIRALEKEKAAALAEVNKIRTDKKVSTREMIVDLPAGLNETLKTQVETILEGLDVQHTTWQSPVSSVIKLRRKIDSRYDEDLGHWVPCPQRIVDEDHVIIVLTAVELVKLAQDGLDAYLETLTAQLPTKRQLFILEGVTPWMRKNRNARNRQFASGVRNQDNSTSATSSQPRRRGNAAPPPEPISDDIVEDAMLQLQVAHGALVHHTNIPLETAQWIGHFTQHLSTAPYRRQRDRSTTTAGFCMESGQVRTGDDAADTYVRMLQEVARVTQPVAYGVAAEFGTVTRLVKGLEEGGQGRLELVRKCANRDGAFSDRTLGKAISKRLWQVFLGRDDTSTDI